MVIRLSVAQLCPDCDVIYEEVACPTCGTENGLWIEKILGKVKMASGCWDWNGSPNRKNYTMFYRQHRGFPAHRLVYRVLVGSIPAGLQLDHLCRNRSCVNPWHLEPVTNATNCQRGDMAKLTPEEVLAIRAKNLGGTSSGDLAREYGVTSANIRMILRGKTWKETR